MYNPWGDEREPRAWVVRAGQVVHFAVAWLLFVLLNGRRRSGS